MRAFPLLILLFLLGGCPQNAQDAASMPQKYHDPLPAEVKTTRTLAELLPAGFDKAKITLLVQKAKYRLTLHYDKRPIKSYPVVLGPEPVKDKRFEGDGATPEGVFHIRNLYPHDSWSKFLWVDYPTADSWRKHEADKAAGKIPADAGIGSEIGIHGVPNNQNRLIDERSNWTAGCVSLKNPDIDEIYSVSSKGMLIEILP